nr:MAG TPA: hypothetical protein [Caudoviricetes sp.]DAW04116.1 MAG TPA: hypothetical protein [Caudoviricetes sp.]
MVSSLSRVSTTRIHLKIKCIRGVGRIFQQHDQARFMVILQRYILIHCGF